MGMDDGIIFLEGKVRRSRRRRQRIIIGIMGLIVILSMILGLVLTAVPEPKRPTPTPTMRHITPQPTSILMPQFTSMATPT